MMSIAGFEATPEWKHSGLGILRHQGVSPRRRMTASGRSATVESLGERLDRRPSQIDPLLPVSSKKADVRVDWVTGE